MHLDQDWARTFKQQGALWLRNGEPNARHVRLTSGMHSDGFFNSSQLRSRPLLEDIASAWCDLLEDKERGNPQAFDQVDVVVGVPNGATFLGRALAVEVSRRRGRRCAWGRLLKHRLGYQKKVVLAESPYRQVIPGKRVLVCEDAITTGDSVERVCREIKERGGIVLPVVLCAVNRSIIIMKRGKKVLSLVRFRREVYREGDCPLCDEGSEVVSVVDERSWRHLVSAS